MAKVTVGQETSMPEQTYAIKLWDLTTGKELRRLPHPKEHAVNRVAWSPDGRWVLTDYGSYDFGTPNQTVALDDFILAAELYAFAL